MGEQVPGSNAPGEEVTDEAGPAPQGSAGTPPGGSGGERLPLDRLLTGLALVLVGGLWLADAAALVEVRWQAVLPALLALVGVALLATARRESHGGLIAAGIVLGVLVLATADPMAAVVAGVGERAEQPADAAAAEEGYELGVGSLEVDLREADDLEDGLTVPVSVGIGEVVVVLPDDVGAEVEASVGIGETVVLGRSQGGLGVSATETVEGEPVLVLEASAGIGRVEVRR